MINIRLLLSFLFFNCLCFSFVNAQDENYRNKIMDVLCNPDLNGRGYFKKGDRKAAKFIGSEFKSLGLKPISDSYFQYFHLDVNTFPSKMVVQINGKVLIPGKDFQVGPGSTACKGDFSVITLNKQLLDDSIQFEKFKKEDFSDKIVFLDSKGLQTTEEKKALRKLVSNPFKAKGIILSVSDKLTWSVSRNEVNYLLIEIKQEVLFDSIKKIHVDIDQKFIKKYQSQNVIAFIPGVQQPDSFVVFSAHYDHLGKMGKNTFFPGANDNASGIATLLDLAKYYKQNKPVCNMVFMAFGAEEAGLVGSEYYVSNPLFDLKKIKFLINLDLMGYGEDGITVVNGSIFEKEFKLLQVINDADKLLPAVNMRGKAANSDHYHFSENGVKAFFIYTLGKGKAYHDVDDKVEVLSFPKYREIFKLLTSFVEQL